MQLSLLHNAFVTVETQKGKRKEQRGGRATMHNPPNMDPMNETRTHQHPSNGPRSNTPPLVNIFKAHKKPETSYNLV